MSLTPIYAPSFPRKLPSPRPPTTRPSSLLPRLNQVTALAAVYMAGIVWTLRYPAPGEECPKMYVFFPQSTCPTAAAVELHVDAEVMRTVRIEIKRHAVLARSSSIHTLAHTSIYEVLFENSVTQESDSEIDVETV